MPRHAPTGERRQANERRAQPGTQTPLRKLKGALKRPIGLERRDGGLHVVLVDRRRKARDPVHELCEELRARLLDRQLHHPDAPAFAELVTLHDALESKGWDGAATLSSGKLKLALLHGELLAADEPSPTLNAMIGKLRLLLAAAQAREERKAKASDGESGGTEMRETTHEEFEAASRNWAAT